MSTGAAVPVSALAEWWRWLRHPDSLIPAADGFAVLTALTLPWSTTAASIFAACWLAAAALMTDYRIYLQSLRQPICAFPLGLLVLAAAGTLWSEASWSARLWALGPALKLLFLPGLFYHFQRSSRGMWVFAAFAFSCTLLMLLSWLVWIKPELKLTATATDGVPVKNYIDQTQELTLCLFAMLPLVRTLLGERRHILAALCIATMAGFLANMVFVAFARTALIYIPVLLLLFAFRFLSLRAAIVLLGGSAILAATIWSTSPYLRSRVGLLSEEYGRYRTEHASTSTGLRLEYWRKSWDFWIAAPLLGNGTGSTLQLFERAAVGQTGVAAEVIRNPHNQTLHVAVQWGLVGVILLWSMWLAHLALFRGEGLAAWVGLLVVVQNMVSSLANSHIFDFHEGWMYVLGVGVAGGIVLKNRASNVARAAVGSREHRKDAGQS